MYAFSQSSCPTSWMVSRISIPTSTPIVFQSKSMGLANCSRSPGHGPEVCHLLSWCGPGQVSNIVKYHQIPEPSCSSRCVKHVFLPVLLLSKRHSFATRLLGKQLQTPAGGPCAWHRWDRQCFVPVLWSCWRHDRHISYFAVQQWDV